MLVELSCCSRSADEMRVVRACDECSESLRCVCWCLYYCMRAALLILLERDK